MIQPSPRIRTASEYLALISSQHPIPVGPASAGFFFVCAQLSQSQIREEKPSQLLLQKPMLVNRRVSRDADFETHHSRSGRALCGARGVDAAAAQDRDRAVARPAWLEQAFRRPAWHGGLLPARRLRSRTFLGMDGGPDRIRRRIVPGSGVSDAARHDPDHHFPSRSHELPQQQWLHVEHMAASNIRCSGRSRP